MSYSISGHFKFPDYRYSFLSSPDHHPTPAEKQEGHNVGLLEENRDRRAPSPTNSAASKQSGGTALGYNPSAVSYDYKEEPTTTNEPEAVNKRLPWYRKRKGKIGIIVVALLVIIAAAVGGGVAGSHHSHSSKNDANGSNQAGPTNSSTQGGQAGNSPSTSTPLPTSTLPSTSTSPHSTTSAPSTISASSKASSTTPPPKTTLPPSTTSPPSSLSVVDFTSTILDTTIFLTFR